MNETIMSLQQSSGIIPYRFYVARQDFEDMDLSLRRKYHIIFGSQTISLYPTAKPVQISVLSNANAFLCRFQSEFDADESITWRR